MQDAFEQVKLHLRMVLHHRWLGAIAVTLICAAGWTGVWFLPDRYEVETRVYLNMNTVLRPLLKGLAVDNTTRESAAGIMRRTLFSRPNLEQVVRDTDLDLTVTTPDAKEALLEELAAALHMSAIDVPGGDRNRSNDIYRIAYRNEDPAVAKRVIESVLKIFLESILGSSREDTYKAQRFLDTQVEDYARKLEEAEGALKQFKLDHAGTMPEEGRSYAERLGRLETQRQETELKLREVGMRAEALDAQLDEVAAAMKRRGQSTAPEAPPSPLDERIGALEKMLDALRLQYTDEHPDIRSSMRQLETLRAQRESQRPGEEAALEARAEDAPYGASAFQDLKVMIGEARAEEAALEARRDEYARRSEEMRKQLGIIPEVEAQLSKLTRGYDVLRQTYESLVQRRESAQLSDDAERSADRSQFRIIEPPREPVRPVEPDRLRLVTAVFAAAFVGGAALAWLAAQLKPTFYSRQQLRNTMDLPVYGIVAMQWTRGEKRKRQLDGLVLVTIFLGLAGAYGFLMAGYSIYGDPVEMLRILRAKIA